MTQPPSPSSTRAINYNSSVKAITTYLDSTKINVSNDECRHQAGFELLIAAALPMRPSLLKLR